MFIAICGINGSGKTVQAKLLQKHFEDQGRECLVVKAYNDEVKKIVGPLIRSWDNDVATTFFLQAFLSQQYLETKKLLERDVVVIADRWDESYLAHHSNFGFLASDHRLRDALSSVIFNGLLPDVGFVLHLPINMARERTSCRGGERFAGRTDEYYEVIQCEYCKIAKRRDWKIVDATKSPETIHSQIVSTLP